MARRGPPKSSKATKLNFNYHIVGRKFQTERKSERGVRADEPTYGPEWAAVSAAVKRRDDYTCTNRECGVIYRPPMHGKLDVHHIKPRRQGGRDTPDNLRTLCKPCHALEHAHLQKMGYGKPRKR